MKTMIWLQTKFHLNEFVSRMISKCLLNKKMKSWTTQNQLIIKEKSLKRLLNPTLTNLKNMKNTHPMVLKKVLQKILTLNLIHMIFMPTPIYSFWQKKSIYLEARSLKKIPFTHRHLMVSEELLVQRNY